ncbi:methyltransferase domain-containing protein [Curtobacterium flaccumfaciens pv. oortii]|uniref:methyltransferase domain-containing protein n=1 Tax=Curtobacterium flaccumfaciens TaxID=2035 RepID=UPI001BDF08F2|nr:methyltransferase domain-containing protein [Curtobacterium flaccumfaciens]MBT1623402.1 methyltransferase domain-containing protein [Curtobacterium flaccumfaciens pv. oortii]
MRWDPSRYAAFADDRGRPFHDLVAQVAWPAGDGLEAPRRVVDLGCGPGALTATLAARWRSSPVVGIDSSAEMLASAAADPALAGLPNLSFELGAIEDWTPGPTDDVVVTNAALQWVPSHVALLPRWLDAMPSGSWFAMQVPGNFGSPSHALMRSIGASGPWASALDGVLREDPVLDPAGYLGIMLDAGFAARAWETTYAQLLPGEDPVLDWVRGTGLRPALAALDAADPSGALTAEYVERYRVALREAYPASAHGTVYPFRRVFAVGRKP